MNLHNKVAVVTGAASGLGRAACAALAEAGCDIAALDLDTDRLDALRFDGVRVFKQQSDVADAGSNAHAIAATMAALGRIDVLVNCAGVADAAKTVSKGKPFPLEIWQKVIAVNLTGTFDMIRLCAAEMIANEPNESGERGVIINTSSGAATQGQVGQAAYAASKAGVMGLTLPVARDLAREGVRVVSIAPGLFDTNMVAGLPQNVTDAMIEKMMLFPMRMGAADEFAGLVRHIAENGYINGTTIDIDGGARMAAR